MTEALFLVLISVPDFLCEQIKPVIGLFLEYPHLALEHMRQDGILEAQFMKKTPKSQQFSDLALSYFLAECL